MVDTAIKQTLNRLCSAGHKFAALFFDDVLQDLRSTDGSFVENV